MTKQINKEPAYPIVENVGDTSFISCIGLTKREAFAMAAMQGLIANGTITKLFEKTNMSIEDQQLAVSKSAVKLADSLLEELSNDT